MGGTVLRYNIRELKDDFQSILAVSGFVFVFVLNLLICYTSVIAYMKFLSPPLRDFTFTNVQ